MKTVKFTYGIGYGRQKDSFEVEDDETEEEIEKMVQTYVMDRLEWGFEIMEEGQ